MRVFLTSSPGGSYKDEFGVRIPCELDNSNGFVMKVKEYWPNEAKGLIVAAYPDDAVINDSLRSQIPESFWMSGLPFRNLEVCDARNEEQVRQLVKESNVIILAGGHVPTQNEFFWRIHLNEVLHDYPDIIIGISAGSMNSARIVYAQPEEEGEAANPCYERYLDGLGLTDVRILPHYQYNRGLTLDGKRVFEDICIPDSRIRSFYALVDGSYIFIDKDGTTTLYGEAYLLEDGFEKKVCERNQKMRILS